VFATPTEFSALEEDSEMEIEAALVSKRHHNGATFSFE